MKAKNRLLWENKSESFLMLWEGLSEIFKARPKGWVTHTKVKRMESCLQGSGVKGAQCDWRMMTKGKWNRMRLESLFYGEVTRSDVFVKYTWADVPVNHHAMWGTFFLEESEGSKSRMKETSKQAFAVVSMNDSAGWD